MRPGDLLEQRYRLVRVLGRGRSGSVWCARNELIDRSVAVKVLHRSLAADPERLQRFFQEARACGRVRHPAVVEVLDLGQGDDGVLFLVMELLEGETMASLLGRKGRLSVDEALALVIPLAHGLSAAHAHGILHRDLKPANIYLHKTPTGGLQPKILDFGISKIIGNDVTATGVVLGTPSYMSPEQARGVPDLDPRTDVWSLGVILYEALTGRLPFVAKEYRALVDEIIEKRHVPVNEIVRDVPAEVARVVDEALEKSRDRRLPSASALAQKLTTILRARGRAELLRSAEDEFSEGAPTLTRDRDEVLKPSPPAPIDETVGDHLKLAPPEPAPEVPAVTRPGVGMQRPTMPGGAHPAPSTQAIAAQTSGAKRLNLTAPRPAAGAPARPSSSVAPSSPSRAEALASSMAARPIENAEETAPDPMPLVNKHDAPKVPESGRANTQSWEVSAAKAASGRAEVILGGQARAPLLQVDQDWDTTVADVSAQEMEKGPLPKLAPPAPMVSEPPPAKRETGARPALQRSPATTTADERPLSRRPSLPPAEVPRKGLGAIPGFTAPTPAAPPVAATAPSGAAGAPADAARAASLDQPVPSKRPPRAPPKSIPPGNGFSGRTLRPPAEGFAHPGPAAQARTGPAQPARPSPPPRRPSQPPPRVTDAPILSPDLLALGDQPLEAPPDLGPPSSQDDPPSSESNGQAVVLSSDPNSETDRRRRAARSFVPMMAAAVALLFVFGAIVGTAMARSNKSDPQHVERFTAMNVLLVAWHDQAAKVAAAEAKKTKATDETPGEPAATTQPSAVKTPEPPEPPPSATAPPAPKPAATPKPVAKPAPKPLPKATSTATTKPKTAPTTETPKKKSGDKEWWQKKF